MDGATSFASVGGGFRQFFGLVLRELLERCAVMAQRSRGEKRIVRRNDQARARQRLYRNKSGRGFEFRMHVVTCEKIDAVKRVAGD